MKRADFLTTSAAVLASLFLARPPSAGATEIEAQPIANPAATAELADCAAAFTRQSLLLGERDFIGRLIRAAVAANSAGRQAALASLAPLIATERDLVNAAQFALIGGAIVQLEDEAPAVFAAAVVDAFAGALDLASLLKKGAPTAAKALAKRGVTEEEAWDVLDRLYQPVVGVLTLSPARRAAAKLRLLSSTQSLADLSDGAYWATRLFLVLDDAPFLAIEPASDYAVEGRMSGIVTNFQLHVLLMDAFHRRSASSAASAISEGALLAARGIYPAGRDVGVRSCWQLYGGDALDDDGTLPDPSETERAIWNDDTPADIPLIAGRRVILAARADLSIEFDSIRAFRRFPAELRVDRVLGSSATRDAISALPRRRRAT